MKRTSLVVLLLFFACAAFYTNFHKNVVSTKQSPTPTPSVEPSPVLNIATHHCIDPSELSAISGFTLSLTRETQLPEVNLVECQYDTTDSINGVTPSLHYIYQLTSDQSVWMSTRASIAQKASVRYISNKDYLIADLNPVMEIAQVTFYGYKNAAFVQLNYTPVSGQTGDVLDKGEKLIEKIFEKG